MFRAILEFLAMLVFFAVVRAAISRLFRVLGGSVRTAASGSNPFADAFRQASSQPARESNIQSAGELRKDPVCGTFVPIATSLQRIVDGKPFYFCSQDCRDRYLVHAK